MIERRVTFEVHPGKEKDFETLFAEGYAPAMSRQPGFVSVTLLCDQEKPSVYQMAIRFDSLETAALWRASAAHQELAPRIKALYGASSLQVYEVVHLVQIDKEKEK
jgi:heme-degrading monooxygenase HmoA